MLHDIARPRLRVAPANTVQSFTLKFTGRCKALPPSVRPRKLESPQIQVSAEHSHDANVRLLRQPGPWPGAEDATPLDSESRYALLLRGHFRNLNVYAYRLPVSDDVEGLGRNGLEIVRLPPQSRALLAWCGSHDDGDQQD